jgi:predicted enzyme related to lactoylglutathione lyase
VHFEIPTNEPEKIARFYEQLFSWKIAKVPMGPMDYWLISHKDAGENETMGGLYKKTMGETGFLNHFSVVNTTNL